MIAGARPSRTSENANVDAGPASAMSQAPTSPMPPARTCPSMLATTGLGSAMICRSSPISRAVPWAIPPARASVRSAPAQNVDPVWVSSTARTPSSAAAAASASSSCVISAADSALRLRGESSAIRAMPRSAE